MLISPEKKPEPPMRSIALLLLLLLLVRRAGPADDAAPPAQKPSGKATAPVSLFDGKTLKGWKVTGCEAIVEDGAILLKAGNGLVRTERTFRDFVLEVEWKALKADNWDSGVYFRSTDPPKGSPWPKTYQANLKKGMEGNVEELKDARSKGLTKPGEWNKFKLAVRGSTAALEINGKPAWKADGVKTPEGFIALQAEIPGGGQFLFREIRILELGKDD